MFAAAIVVAGATFAGGVAVGRSTDRNSRGITEAEHDRLVDACVAETDDGPGCVSWVADLVVYAEERGLSYDQVSGLVVDELAPRPDAQAQRDAEAQELDRRVREMCELVDSIDGQPPPGVEVPTTAPGQVDICDTQVSP
jgi:hypothetical protein